MMVIAEHDLGIVCEAGKCTRTATYICNIKADETLHRLYCPKHTATLLQGVAKVLLDSNSERPLHDVVETERLLTGESINV